MAGLLIGVGEITDEAKRQRSQRCCLMGKGINKYQHLPAYKYLGYSENAGLNFYLRLPSDYPAYPEEEIMGEYNRMAEDVESIAEMAKIRKSSHYYPGDEADIDDGNGLG